jgi:opacity protein-like surface antigen
MSAGRRVAKGLDRQWLPACVGTLVSLSTSIFAFAQTGLSTAEVPSHSFYVGLGGSYNSANFGTQDVYAIGTSDVYQNGSLVATGYAAGPASVYIDSRSTLAPAVHAGYFARFTDGNALWGVKFAYTYLATTSTRQNVLLPQVGSFTYTASNTTVPFTGNAFVRSYQTSIEHQMALMPFIGQRFERSYVYIGAGPTLSRTQTDLNGLVGFADINGKHTDVSGAPVDFSSSSWVWGGAAVVGASYFLDRSWFVDLSYTYAATRDHTSNYSGTFTNSGNSFGTTTGTLVGTSAGKMITQGVMVTINRAF